VLLNIALNSIDALPISGHIWLQVGLQQKGLAITICDDGPGIADADKEKIFTPFFTTKEGGTGLGLPISRRIIESYGGTLTCADSPHGGACFTILLPRRNEPAADQLLDEMAAEEAGKNELSPLKP
jgi:signal transduction histidine kinase